MTPIRVIVFTHLICSSLNHALFVQLDLLGMGTVDEEHGTIQLSAPGDHAAIYTGASGSLLGATLSVFDNSVRIMEINPVLASLRLNPTSNQAASRLGETEVSLEILSGLFFFRERSQVTVSAVLENGRRFVITDPAEILLQSSNSSILMVDSNYVVARGVGTVELNVTWMVCRTILGRSTIEITVEFNENRPIFENNPQRAEIAENSPLGTTVTAVIANDLDFANADSARRDTEYRFMDESSSHDGLFVLDKITGLISLNGPLDREMRDSYTILLEATDRAQRLAEQQRRALLEEGVGGSGSGSGDLLMPDRSPTLPPLPSLRIDTITVRHCTRVV